MIYLYISYTSKSIIFSLFFEDNREQEINPQKCVPVIYPGYMVPQWNRLDTKLGMSRFPALYHCSVRFLSWMMELFTFTVFCMYRYS